MTFDAHPRSSLIVALDFDSLPTALKFAKQIADLVGMFKIGKQLFTSAGPEAVRQMAQLGTGIFLDLKYHDIPNTVAGAVLAAASLPGVQLVNVHALGGTAMLQAAVQAISAGVPMGADRPRLLAVTVLTSMDKKSHEGSRNWRASAIARAAPGKAGEKSGSGWRGGFGAGSESDPQSVRARVSDCDAGCAAERKRRRRQER